MTRKEFLNNMVKSILGYSIIEYKEKQDDRVKYTKTGTLIKDCTYTQHYHNKIVELICSIFDENIKSIMIENKDKPVKTYQDNARKFLYNIIKNSSEEKTNDQLNQLFNLNLAEMNKIYTTVIIDEIFNDKKYIDKSGNENFDDSLIIIIEDININIYEARRQKIFASIVADNIENNYLELDIFYKSSELGKRFADIKEYIKFKKYDFVILNNNNVTDFQENIVYRYTGECFFEIGERNEIITYFIYNNQKIQSYTSVHNWLNQSILSNYAYEGASRYFNCYFFYDQGRMFKFLQISEANITAEIQQKSFLQNYFSFQFIYRKNRKDKNKKNNYCID